MSPRPSRPKQPTLVALATLRAGDTFRLPDSERTGILLSNPSFGSVYVRLVRPNKDPALKPEVQTLHIAPGTAVIHTGHDQRYVDLPKDETA